MSSRIISARKAAPYERRDITMKTAKHDWSRVDAMTDEEAHAAALNDPDARPLTEADFTRMRRVPLAKTLRRALGLTQEQFAARFQIPLGTLRDWEQGRAEPDQPARSYLKVIAREPKAVERALRSRATDPRRP
jgi:putative transcriptional regulator